MRAGNFAVTYKLVELGRLGTSKAQELSLLDITNYSLEGVLQISRNAESIVLVQVPLLEAFYAFRLMLQIVPIFAKKVSYAQMFREASTTISIEDETLVIEHKEIRALEKESGTGRLNGSYVQFCSEYGRVARSFLRELKTASPSLFDDERVATNFADLFNCLKFEDGDLSAHPIL
jgi:hypothetical protein